MAATTRSGLLLTLTALALALAGCESPDGKSEFKGTATWNGEPIAEGYVELHSVGAGQVDGAEIVGGNFTIRTTEGEKRALVIAKRKVGETPATERIPHPEPIYHQYLPKEFNDKSTLKVTLTAADPTLKLDLRGKDRPRVTDPQRKSLPDARP